MIYIIFTNKLFHYLKEKVIVMRKITLLVLLFAVVGNIKAAHYEYIPLVRDGVEWGYSQQLFGKSYYRNLIQADTIVNDIAYKKFYTFKSCSETADENLAFIRESGKQVYITFNKLLMPVESLCDREYLIYDFGVKESETIYNPQIQISAESGTKRSKKKAKEQNEAFKKKLHTTLIKPEQKVNEDLCSGFIVS